MISMAIAEAERLATSTNMARKIQGTGKLMLVWKGDMPLDLFIERKSLVAFLVWCRRLPKKHGQLHGNNRFRSDRIEPDKHQVIADADERDRLLREEVAARDDLDLRGKRALLAKKLEPRLTDDAVEKHHARVTAIIGAARRELGWRGPAFQSVLPDYRKEAARVDNRAEDPLDLRVTKSKKRSVWSAERTATLLTSPIYAGCSSVHRRWKPGGRIIRDALYWLPLIQLTMGPRPEEAATLRKDSVLCRDDIYCMRVRRQIIWDARADRSLEGPGSSGRGYAACAWWSKRRFRMVCALMSARSARMRAPRPR
jgi:hypothetical protein